MADSSILNIVSSYVGAVSDTSSTQKSYMDKSSNDFSDIFNTANQTYNSDKSASSQSVNSSNVTTNKPAEQKTAADNSKEPVDTSNAQNHETKNSSQAQEHNVEEKNPENEHKGNSKQNDKEEASGENKQEIVEKTEQAVAETVSKEEDRAVNVIKTSEIAAIEQKFKTAVKSLKAASQDVKKAVSTLGNELKQEVTVVDNSEKNTADATAVLAENTVVKAVDPVDSIINTTVVDLNIVDLTAKLVANANVGAGAEAVQDAVPAGTKSEQVVTIPQSGQNVQDAIMQQNLNANLVKTLNNLKNSQVGHSNTQVQKNMAEVNVELPNNIVKQQQTAQANMIVTQNTELQAPVIEVSTEALASDVNINPAVKNVQNVKDILAKTSLTQDALEKLNAKITKVETKGSGESTLSYGNNNQNMNADIASVVNNLSVRQNTQDQMAKLSIEVNTSEEISVKSLPISSNVSDLLSMTSSAGQADFSKTQDLVKVQVPAQAPKTISDSEILSQVNSKLNNFKDEDTSKVTIVLRPENLGKVNLELVTTKEGLTAQMTTDNPHVKEILDKSLDNLKNSLSSQGVNVNSVSVKVEEAQKHSAQGDMFEFTKDQSQTNNQNSSSGNNNGRAQQNFTIEEEYINEAALDNNESENYISNEQTVSIGSGMGKVSYKV